MLLLKVITSVTCKVIFSFSM